MWIRRKISTPLPFAKYLKRPVWRKREEWIREGNFRERNFVTIQTLDKCFSRCSNTICLHHRISGDTHRREKRGGIEWRRCTFRSGHSHCVVFHRLSAPTLTRDYHTREGNPICKGIIPIFPTFLLSHFSSFSTYLSIFLCVFVSVCSECALLNTNIVDLVTSVDAFGWVCISSTLAGGVERPHDGSSRKFHKDSRTDGSITSFDCVFCRILFFDSSSLLLICFSILQTKSLPLGFTNRRACVYIPSPPTEHLSKL